MTVEKHYRNGPRSCRWFTGSINGSI